MTGSVAGSGGSPGSGAGAFSYRHPIVALLVRRIASGVVTMFIVSVLIFVVVQVLPGNAAEVALGKNATPGRVAALNKTLGLDQPLWLRYAKFIGHFVTGDLGVSTSSAAAGSPVTVTSLIGHPLLNSFFLALLAMVLLVPSTLFLGAFAAYRAGRPADHVISTVSIIEASLPEFLMGTLLIAVFFSILNVLPPVSQFGAATDLPWAHLDLLVLPTLTLLLATVGYTTRLVRAATVDVLRQNYVAVGRINGFRERTVLYRFAVRNSLAPSLQALALTAQYLIGGVVVVESVFNYSGIGKLLVSAVQTRDAQLITVISTLLAAAYIAINILADILVILLSPRLRAPSR